MSRTPPEDARHLLDWIHRPRHDDDEQASLNVCFNALDRHVVRGRGDHTAVVDDSTSTRLTYAQLLERVAALGGALRALGVGVGDRVLVLLPDALDSAVTFLACARVGAVHVSLPAGLAPAPLGEAVDRLRPVLAVAETDRDLRTALAAARHVPRLVLVRRVEGRSPGDDRASEIQDWDIVVRAGAQDPAACLELPASAPLSVTPEGRIRQAGPAATGLAAAMSDLAVGAGDVWWAPGVGPTDDMAVLGPLMVGAGTVLAAASPADPLALAAVVRRHGVTHLMLPGRSDGSPALTALAGVTLLHGGC